MKLFIIILLAVVFLVGIGAVAVGKAVAEQCTDGECVSQS